jgi:sugar/nucleoside kinase (ribokinase family)
MMQQALHSGLPKVFVTGDLAVDNVVTGIALGGITRVAYAPPAVGGSAYNAAIAFKHAGFSPIVFGKVGKDANGNLILSTLERDGIYHFIDRDDSNPTCSCNIIYFQDQEHLRTIYYSKFTG